MEGQVNIEMQVHAGAEPTPVDADAHASHAGDDPNAAAGAGAGDAVAAPPADGQEDPVAEEVAAAAAQQATEDAEYLNKMRGWLMTVATLFVGFAFQAAMNPPLWIPKGYLAQWITGYGTPASDSRTKDDAVFNLGIRDGRITAPCFMLLNTITFGTGLALLVTLLMMGRAPSRSDMRSLTIMVMNLAITVACTFACGISGDVLAALAVLGYLATYAVAAVAGARGWFPFRSR